MRKILETNHQINAKPNEHIIHTINQTLGWKQYVMVTTLLQCYSNYSNSKKSTIQIKLLNYLCINYQIQY